MKPVVVIIFHHKSHLEWFERIALEQCFRILGRHPIRLVCPKGLDLREHLTVVPELEADFIPAHWLSGHLAYNHLKVSPFLYRRYAQYEYMLTYELDAFVFRDELLDWCRKGWDYIGAPWFDGSDAGGIDAKPLGVGNSGFSLRRGEAMLRAARSWRYQKPVSEILRSWKQGKRGLKGVLAALTCQNNFFAPFNNFVGNEDRFWCRIAAPRFPWFRLAPYEVARRFSFEVNPSRLYQECGNSLPFGCHKWMSYEPLFWSQHMQSYGYEVAPVGAKVAM